MSVLGNVSERQTRSATGALPKPLFDLEHAIDYRNFIQIGKEFGPDNEGVFTTRDLPKLALLGQYNERGNRPLTYIEAEQQRTIFKNDCLLQVLRQHKWINPKKNKDKLLAKINHGCHNCEANVDTWFSHLDRSINFSTTIAVKASTYLRWDYGMEWRTEYEDDRSLDWLRDYSCHCRGRWVPLHRVHNWEGEDDSEHPNNKH